MCKIVSTRQQFPTAAPHMAATPPATVRGPALCVSASHSCSEPSRPEESSPCRRATLIRPLINYDEHRHQAHPCEAATPLARPILCHLHTRLTGMVLTLMVASHVSRLVVQRALSTNQLVVQSMPDIMVTDTDDVIQPAVIQKVAANTTRFQQVGVASISHSSSIHCHVIFTSRALQASTTPSRQAGTMWRSGDQAQGAPAPPKQRSVFLCMLSMLSDSHHAR